MKRRQKEQKKYPTTNRQNLFLNEPEKDSYLLQNKSVPEEIREQLRAALEELQHHRLTSDLEVQKRLLLEQQLKNVRQQNEELRYENDQLKKQLSKVSKKYSKIKQKKECDKCKAQQELSAKLEKEREIYLNDRKIMQDQIKSLKAELESTQISQQRDRLLVLTDSLYKQLQISAKKIEQQAKIIHFLNEKLSEFEMQNIEVMNKVDLLQGKLSEMEIDSLMNRKKVFQNDADYSRKKGEDYRENGNRSRKRRNGSIQNVKKTERDDFGSDLQRYEP